MSKNSEQKKPLPELLISKGILIENGAKMAKEQSDRTIDLLKLTVTIGLGGLVASLAALSKLNMPALPLRCLVLLFCISIVSGVLSLKRSIDIMSASWNKYYKSNTELLEQHESVPVSPPGWKEYYIWFDKSALNLWRVHFGALLASFLILVALAFIV